MARIGIMGGTFNPIHIGHIEIAKAAFFEFHLDEVWFMPNHIPAYKDEDKIVSGEDRFNMVSLAIKEFPYFKASDYELKREGNTYTADTLTRLHEDYTEHEFYFIMGADSLFYFEKWKSPETIVKYATILAAPRDEKSLSEMKKRIKELNKIFHGEKFYLIDCPKIDCSSSEIREYLSGEKRTDKDNLYLSEEVYNYIKHKQLYS